MSLRLPSRPRPFVIAASAAVLALACGAAYASSLEESLPHTPEQLQHSMLGEVGKTFGALGTPSFVAFDQGLSPIARTGRAGSSLSASVDADSAYLLWGDENSHSVKVYVGSADGDTAAVACNEGPAALALTCAASDLPNGGTVVTSTYAIERRQELGGAPFLVSAEALPDTDPATLRLERNVRFFHEDGSMTSVTETVSSPGSTRLESVFKIPVETLERVATDPGLSWR